MNISNLIASAIITAIALPAISQAAPAPVPSFTSEKCYGIAARGSNDCGTQTHSWHDNCGASTSATQACNTQACSCGEMSYGCGVELY